MKKSYIIEGIIFIIFMSLFFYLGIKAFNHFFDIGKTYKVVFHDIDGIVTGSPVRMMGVDVGNVTKVQINRDSDEIELNFVIYDKNIPIPAGTLATIEFSGLAGSRSIELYPPQSEFIGRGFQLEEPIRVGDAIDIMGKLGDAMMKSVAGIFEFAKSRPQSQFSDETQAILNSTRTIETSIVSTTDKLANIDNNIHGNFVKVINFAEGTKDFAISLNEKADIHSVNYVLKFSKRNVVNLHRDLKNFDKNMQGILLETNNDLEKIRGTQLSYNFKEINANINFLGNSLCMIDEILCVENLTELKIKTEKVKTFSQKLDNSL